MLLVPNRKCKYDVKLLLSKIVNFTKDVKSHEVNARTTRKMMQSYTKDESASDRKRKFNK